MPQLKTQQSPLYIYIYIYIYACEHNKSEASQEKNIRPLLLFRKLKFIVKSLS